jgi:hypothetical protein
VLGPGIEVVVVARSVRHGFTMLQLYRDHTP